MASTTAVYRPAAWTLSARQRELLIRCLFFVGLISIAAVHSGQMERRDCGPFTIGQSAVGSCDYILD